jgi:hypothetical protein
MRNCTASAMRLVHDDGIAGHNPSPTISSCVFTSNTNSGNGGAIAMDGPDISVLIDGCTFTDNVVNVQPSLFNGGAISGENGATVEIQGSSFTGNTARYGDAVYLIDSGDWAIRGSTFLGNGIAGTDAYAVYSMNGDLGVIEDCLFDANQNAIKASDSVFALRRTTVQGCLGATFSENSVELQGPGPWQVVTVTDCNFYNNAAAGHTLSLGQGSSTVERCTFNSNSGVAVAGYGDLVSIRNSVFTLNQGAVYFNGKRLELESSEITGSHFYGSYPNVIGYHGNSIRMVDNLVQSNSMLYSSPLYIQFNEGTDSRPSLISGNHIEDNSTSQDYGLLHINLNFSPYEIPVRNNVFSNNVNQGNGIINVYRWSETTGWVNFRDNLVHGNQAVDGGGLYVNGHTTASHTIRVHNCTITGNTASRAGGGIHVNEGKVEIKNSIIWGNTDGNSGVDSGDNLYVNQVSAPVVNVDNCDIGSAAGQIYDPSMIINTPNGFLSGTRGNLSADPLFVTGPDGVYYLSHVAAGQASTSPCVNAGSTTAAALGLDLWTTRTDGVTDSGTVDLGYHYIP